MSRVNLPLTTEHALLGFLRRRPMYGYEIHQQLTHSTGLGLVWRLKQSQLYALLTKLEEAGYVTTTIEPQETRPPRKIFELTDTGRAAFLNWVQQPVPQGRSLRLDFLAKLYFARFEGPEVATQLIQQQQTICRNWLLAQQREAEMFGDQTSFDRLVHEFRLGQIEAMLAWLDTCQETLALAVT